jgi:glycosyltransferase involved in cell wall biosynthesis
MQRISLLNGAERTAWREARVTRPTVSVIMAAYQEPTAYLRSAIESILNQTLRSLELIIVLDDPKNLDARRIITRYAGKDGRVIVFVNETNLGRAASRNRAVDAARGEYIAVLDADDIAMPHRLEIQVKYMRKNRGIDLLFSGAYIIDAEGHKVERFIPGREKFAKIRHYFFTENLTIHSTMLVKSAILKELKYDPAFVRSQDYEFWLRCLAKGYLFDAVDEPLISYRIPALRNVDERIRKQFLYGKYGAKAFWKNFPHFAINGYYLWAYARYILFYIAIKMTPMPLLRVALRMKGARR